MLSKKNVITIRYCVNCLFFRIEGHHMFGESYISLTYLNWDYVDLEKTKEKKNTGTYILGCFGTKYKVMENQTSILKNKRGLQRKRVTWDPLRHT